MTENIPKTAQNDLTKDTQTLTTNTQNLTKDTQTLTTNTQNLTTNAQKIHKNTQNLTTNAQNLNAQNNNNTQNQFSCEICEKTFSRIDNLTRHKNLYCKEYVLGYEITSTDEYKCNFCGKNCKSRGSMNRHLRSYCKKKDEIERAIRKDGKSPQHISNISNISNNISNISNNNSHNTTNINVTLNAYGNENIGHLIPVVYKLIKDHAESAVTDLICERYFHPEHPENKTVMLKPKEKWPGRKFNGERWEVDDKISLITDVLEKNFTLLDKMFAVVKHTMHPFCDWTEIRKKWGRKEEPSTETKEITEKILMNQSLSGSGYRKKENED